MLDALEKANAKASFFVLGSKVSGREHLLKRMVQNSCDIGCHMLNQEYITGYPDVVLDSLERTHEAICAASGVSPVLMRLLGDADSPENREPVSGMASESSAGVWIRTTGLRGILPLLWSMYWSMPQTA